MRSRLRRAYELAEAGKSEDGRFLNVTIEYPKAAAGDELMRTFIENAAPGSRRHSPVSACRETIEKKVWKGQTIKAVVFSAYGTLYEVESVERAVEHAFPGRGRLINYVWRMKQLEYSWLSTLVDRYEDFWHVTLHSLEYSLRSLNLSFDSHLLQDIAAKYLDLKAFEDAQHCLERLAPIPRAILSNGSRAMLNSLAVSSKLDHHFDHVLSVDGNRTFKPAPQAYALVEEALGFRRDEVMFVSSHGLDICGAKSFGFAAVRIARAGTAGLSGSLPEAIIDDRITFNLKIGNRKTRDCVADVTVGSLADIPGLFTDDGLAV